MFFPLLEARLFKSVAQPPIAGDQATTLGQKATQKNSWASGSISSNHLKTERKGFIEYCCNRTLASRKGTRYF